MKFATKKKRKTFCRAYFKYEKQHPQSINTINTKFTRKVKNSKYGKEIFTYPNVEDVCEVNRDDLENVLPRPKIIRTFQAYDV